MTLRDRARSIGLSRRVTTPVRPLPRLPRSTNPWACRTRSAVGPRVSSGDGGWITRGRTAERLRKRVMDNFPYKVAQNDVDGTRVRSRHGWKTPRTTGFRIEGIGAVQGTRDAKVSFK